MSDPTLDDDIVALCACGHEWYRHDCRIFPQGLEQPRACTICECDLYAWDQVHGRGLLAQGEGWQTDITPASAAS